MLQLNESEYNRIMEHALSNLPNEACGLIGGIIENYIKIVKEVYLLRNIEESREHFTMDPLEQLASVKDIRKKGYILFGNFHSHPETPARPSSEDIRLAYDPNISYLILSLRDREKPVLKAFRINNGTVLEEQLIIIR